MKLIFIFIFIFLYSQIILANELIPIDPKNWTKFESLPSLKIYRPVLINKHINGVGIISEETQPKDEIYSPNKWCTQFEGVQKKQYCRVDKTDVVTFIFRKEFEKGITFQSVTFEKNKIELINNFEAGIK